MGMADRGFQVRALGEIAIRCSDMTAMEGFYRDVIGLELLARREPGITFFKVADGFAGHTCVLALFGPAAEGPVCSSQLISSVTTRRRVRRSTCSSP